MITFAVSVVILIVGYLLYGRLCERIFIIDSNRATPAQTLKDGVDYVVLPGWKIFTIQFLNIAGLGPVFGAVAGAMWGPVAFLWIALGSIFAGGVHDYFSGMLSLRHRGQSISEVSGYYLGNWVKPGMRIFSVILLVMVGVVFIIGPAKILSDLTKGWGSFTFWMMLIFLYYILSTILPVDRLIGKIYPVFGFALLFMAAGILVMMIANGLPVPELTIQRFTNMHVNPDRFPVFPMLFVTIACGAISGFHATQSPLMARCMANEKQGRPIFYGAMITEGIVAMVWAAIAMCFYGGVSELNGVLAAQKGNAALVVNEISVNLLGSIGGALAILGVVAAPITSGDTAFRSARLTIADLMKLKQGPLANRLFISLPLFVIGFFLTQVDYAIIWRYFAWTNQTLATIVLWVITIFLIKENKWFWIAMLPAVFMTAVVVAYILVAPEGFGFSIETGYITGTAAAAIAGVATLIYKFRKRRYRLTSLGI